VVVPYFLWRWVYYGYPLPNTLYAKSLGLHPRAFLEGLFYLYQVLHGVGGVFFVGLLALLALTAQSFPDCALLVSELGSICALRYH